eukprot:scaffold6776_cov99-Skeletonema_dohrnii-CCMP3373.AAC.12
MTKDIDSVNEANNMSNLMKWGRIQDNVPVFMTHVNFEQFAKLHHPISPQLTRSFIEVFAALINIIGFVVLASTCRYLSGLFRVSGLHIFCGPSVRGLYLHFFCSSVLVVLMGLSLIGYATNGEAAAELKSAV